MRTALFRIPGGTSATRGYWFVLAIIFLVPRLFRLLYPEVWLEDPYYLYASRLIAGGAVPFRDFGHTQLPGAEYLLAWLYLIFGASLRTAEIASQIVVYLSTWLIFLIGSRLKDRTAGIGSGILFSCSALVFRYHVWEREILILFILALAFYLILTREKLNDKRAVVLGLLFGAGVFIKMTTAVPLAAAILFLAFIRKDLVHATIAALAAFIFITLALGCLFFLAPGDFFNQALLYHFVKGETVSSLGLRLSFQLHALDVSLAAGLLGLFFLKKTMFPDFWFPVFVTLADWVFFTFISPNVWPHNFIPALLLLSLSGGILVSSLRHFLVRQHQLLRPAIIVAAFVLLLATFIPLRNMNWIMGEPFGFGYIPREDIHALSEWVRTKTTGDDLLLIPQYIASESGRRTVMSDRVEAAGVLAWIGRNRKAGLGPQAIIRLAQGNTFAQMQRKTLSAGWGTIDALLQRHKIRFVVPDFVPGETIPYGPEQLAQYGYAPFQQYGRYTVWSVPL